MEYHDLSILFLERPCKYGLRGDFYFWEYLEKYFREHPELCKKEDIAATIKRQFRKLSKVELTADATPYVQELAHGGMSSGILCGAFWLNDAIPLLLDRFDRLK